MSLVVRKPVFGVSNQVLHKPGGTATEDAYKLEISDLDSRGIVLSVSDFIWPFLPPFMGVIPNPKMAFIFPISCILALIFPIFMKYFPKCSGKGSFPKSQIKSLYPCSENKGADQLRGYREADLCLCFRICKKPVFLWRGSYDISHMHSCKQA